MHAGNDEYADGSAMEHRGDRARAPRREAADHLKVDDLRARSQWEITSAHRIGWRCDDR